MNKETFRMIERLKNMGISEDDAWSLRRVAMTLHRWAEMECGTDRGSIERDEKTGKPYWKNANIGGGSRWSIPDRERGALKRLGAIMARYPGLVSYHQTDPRGASLYVLRESDIPDGASMLDSCYSRGVAVFK